jgi:GDP-L-fucose synthase
MGRDNFSLEQSHVIAELIKKFVDAKLEGSIDVVVWGTGKASREFLYVEDAAEAILLSTERHNKSEPVNFGAGQEITIRELVDLIVELPVQLLVKAARKGFIYRAQVFY